MKTTDEIRAAEDINKNTVAVELAHREALAEDREEADRRAAMVRQQDENEREQSDMDE